MLRTHASRVALIVLFALLIGYYDLPGAYQKIYGTPESLKNEKVILGLDLQGGSQLDYKIDLREVPKEDQKSIIEGVKTVIDRRVNSLGVSEPNIYTSTVGNEEHLIVELAGIKDLEKAKEVVGKTIQLEFKEKREKQDPQYKEKIRQKAAATLKKVLANKNDFTLIGTEEEQADPANVTFKDEWVLRGDLRADEKRAETVFGAKTGSIVSRLIEGSNGYTVRDGQVVELQGFFVVYVEGERDGSSLPEEQRALEVSHILVAYEGSERATDGVVRTKAEAKKLAEETLGLLKNGESFEKLARERSDEPGAKESSGKLTGPVRKDSGYDADFTAAALKLTKKSELSGVVETPFGFHIIRADDLTQRHVYSIFYASNEDIWQETPLTGEHFERAEVTFDQLLRPIVSINFNEEGAKLFEEITDRNVGKPVAIFVGGNLISSPNVNEKISGGQATITGQFSVEEAQDLARDLNTGAIPAPVVLSGQYTIGASLGAEALHKSIRAGVIGFIALAIFMTLYYRLPGLIATGALTLYVAILLFLVKSSLPLALSLAVSVLIFVAIIYKILNSREGGWEKFITFVLACFILFFVTFLLANPIVLTLAGIAGVILSIGMAVDANVLIFERMKEELRAGRPLSSAIEIGFDRAWSSIRDSNFSSLITCAILFYFGSSIIRGFAFNLAAGILVSMFTAITITRTLLLAFMRTKLGDKLALWTPSTTKAPEKTYHVVEKSRLWFAISGVIISVALISFAVSGLKLGIDFKGGTLLDLSFGKAVTAEEVKKVIGAESARVVPAGEKQLIVHMDHIDNETHDKLLASLEAQLGEVTENRFTTIGPVVGETLKNKAILAIIITLIAIVIYITFAFRKIPKRFSPWKFGVCAIVALFHDVIIPVGIFSFFQFEVDALFITAILTVLGFSVHDTIVVFDRIRENVKYQERDESFAHVANKSVSQTIARSINTSLTTLITLSALLIFGSPSIFHFVLTLVIGILVGTYSSIFIAIPLLVLWQKKEV